MDSPSWIICAVLGSVTRWCIPLFLMISGAVFLDREKRITQKTILKKYVPKLLAALVVWGAFFYFFELWIYNQPITKKNLILAPINILAGCTGYHLWYLYAIIPIYLLMPALKVFAVNATREQQKNTLLVIITLCGGFSLFNSIMARIPQLRVISIGVMLPELCGYIGCVLTGYFLAHFDLKVTERKVLTVAAIISVICMPAVNMVLSSLNNTYDATLSGYTGICSISVAGWIFTWIKQKKNILQNGKWKSVLLNIGGRTFGIYLVHTIFVSIIFHKAPIVWSKINALYVVGLSTLAVFGISYALSWLLSKIPVIKKIV